MVKAVCSGHAPKTHRATSNEHAQKHKTILYSSAIRKLLDWRLLKVKLSWSFFYSKVRKSESR